MRRSVALAPAVLAAAAVASGFGSSGNSGCTPTHSLQFSAIPSPHFVWQYANCSVPDIDQRRTASGGQGGLPSNGQFARA
jgi:hypothetical protein